MSETKETWLPLFPGFYETVFDSRYDNIEGILFTSEEMELIRKCKSRYNDRYQEAEDLALDMIDWNKFELLKAKMITGAVGEILKQENLISEIGFDDLWQPREYNFYSDKIDISVTLTGRNIDNIKKVLSDNWPEFKENIKRKYTSRDGFISFHSNKANSKDWDFDFILDNEDSHKLGEILDFCLKVSGYTVESIYYSNEYEPATAVFECIKKEYQDRENRIEYIKNELQYNEQSDPLENTGYYNPDQLSLF